MGGFDPYLAWLDIPAHERPVDHYRLLGLRRQEMNPVAINAAADRVTGHLSQFQNTAHAASCTQILAEVANARSCLLDPARRQAYDSGLFQGDNLPAATKSTERSLPPPSSISLDVPSATATPERQISNAPAVPTQPALQPSHLPVASTASGERPLPTVGVPPAMSSGNLVGTAAPGTGPIPTGEAPLQPPTPVPTALPASAPQATVSSVQSPLGMAPPTATAIPTQPGPADVQPNPHTPQPPAWAGEQSTGQVSTVVAGQSSQPDMPSSRGHRSRAIRRQQRVNSTYMLVAFAMAMLVFFFGAVLLLAIFIGGQ